MICSWATSSPEMKAYHDHEWGQPTYEDQALFEKLSLELFQSGLSWAIILKKRPAFRKVFFDFDIQKVAGLTDAYLEGLLEDASIVRHRKKIWSVRANARAILCMQDQGQSFSNYLWSWVNHQPLVNHWSSMDQIPSSTPLSLALSKDLKKRGFQFLGPTTVYSFLEAAGLVNDHLEGCLEGQPDEGR